jgi:hypothetical protein
MSTPPSPTKTGIWPFRRYRECHCKLIRSRNPHLWVRAYCPPQPMPAEVSR